MCDDSIPDTSGYQAYDPDTEEVYPKGQVPALVEQVKRLRKALRRTDTRYLQHLLSDEINRREGEYPGDEWYAQRCDSLESNHYAVDGLQFGDLDVEFSTDEREATDEHRPHRAMI